MFEHYELYELVERAQEIGGQEGDALKMELARRYRQGIGVEPDENEALYWEGLMENRECNAELETPETEPVADPVQDSQNTEEGTEAHYRSLPEEALYQAYLQREPWAVYIFAEHMLEMNDATGLRELKSLAHTLEQGFASGVSSSDVADLLIAVKRRYGHAKEFGEFTEKNLNEARNLYEAAIELGSREAIEDALRCYQKMGRLSEEENSVLPLLQKLANGNPREKLVAAQLYQTLGRITEAAINYKVVAESVENNPFLRAKAMLGRIEIHCMTEQELLARSDNGDAAASFAAGQLYVVQEKYAPAEHMFARAMEQDTVFLEKAEIMRSIAQLMWQKEEQQAIEREKQAIEQAKQEERQRQEEEARQKRESTMWFKARAFLKRFKNHQIFTFLFAILLTIGVKTLVHGAIRSLALVKFDAFENVELQYQGVEPYASVEVVNHSDNSFLQTVSYYVSPSDNLKNGDDITVTATFSHRIAFLAGYKVKERKKTYTVSGVNTIELREDPVDTECRAALEQQAMNQINAYLADRDWLDLYMALLPGENGYSLWSRYGYSGTIGDLSQHSSYLLTIKDGITAEDEDVANKYVITYFMPITLERNKEVFFDGNAYFSVAFSNLSYDEDGNIVVDLNSGDLYSPLNSEEAVYELLGNSMDKYIVEEIAPQ